MSKGFIFDLLKLENGWVLTLFSIFRIGWIGSADDIKFYKCFQLGLSKLELTFSTGWGSSHLEIDDIEGYS